MSVTGYRILFRMKPMSKTRKDYSPRRKEPREDSFRQHGLPTHHLRPMISGNLDRLAPDDLSVLDDFADEFPSFEKI